MKALGGACPSHDEPQHVLSELDFCPLTKWVKPEHLRVTYRICTNPAAPLSSNTLKNASARLNFTVRARYHRNAAAARSSTDMATSETTPPVAFESGWTRSTNCYRFDITARLPRPEQTLPSASAASEGGRDKERPRIGPRPRQSRTAHNRTNQLLALGGHTPLKGTPARNPKHLWTLHNLWAQTQCKPFLVCAHRLMFDFHSFYSFMIQ